MRAFDARPHRVSRKLDMAAALVAFAFQIPGLIHVRRETPEIFRNLMLDFTVRYSNNTAMNGDNKHIQGHSPGLDDLFVTRRQFLQRAGMGFGALGLAALLGEEMFGS